MLFIELTQASHLLYKKYIYLPKYNSFHIIVVQGESTYLNTLLLIRHEVSNRQG